MRNAQVLLGLTAAVFACPFLLTGCDREVSHTTKTSVSSDGSAKQKETVVREAPDGTMTKEETVKHTEPTVP